MTLAAALLLAATAVVVAGPRYLDAFARRACPSLALTAWISSICAVALLAGSALLVLLWPDHAPAERLVELALSCMSTLQHAARPWVGEGIAAVAVAVSITMLLRLRGVARSHLRARSTLRDRHRDLIALVARADDGSDPVLWLDHSLPLAYSIDGRPGIVVATRGLREQLDGPQQRAVLAHERAHLHGRHHNIVNVCEILARAFPFLPLFAAAPSATRLLVEFAADQSAARRTSPEVVRSALMTVALADRIRPTWALGLVSGSTQNRIERLDATSRAQQPSSRAIAAVAILPVALLVLMSTLALGALSALACAVL